MTRDEALAWVLREFLWDATHGAIPSQTLIQIAQEVLEAEFKETA